MRNHRELTLPSYSRRERTSGAMYAGVPTVDFGLECSNDDYSIQQFESKISKEKGKK